MNVSISYFYHVRNMTPDVIPVSTAMYDPKWFHDFKGEFNVFVDKNNVINGIKILPLIPGPKTEGTCMGVNGDGNGCTHDSETCTFLRIYEEQLKRVNFKAMMNSFDNLSVKLKREVNEVVLLVHEKYDNPCSERVVLQKWFKENGVELKEWRK